MALATRRAASTRLRCRRRAARDRASAWPSKVMKSSMGSANCDGRPVRDRSTPAACFRARHVCWRARSSTREASGSARRRRLPSAARRRRRHRRPQLRWDFSADASGRNQRRHSEQRLRAGEAISQCCAPAMDARLSCLHQTIWILRLDPTRRPTSADLVRDWLVSNGTIRQAGPSILAQRTRSPSCRPEAGLYALRRRRGRSKLVGHHLAFLEELSVRIYEPPLSSVRERMRDLPTALRTVVLAIDFDTEVTMQGILGFLENSTGLFLSETITAFEEIGASETARGLSDICDFMIAEGISAESCRRSRPRTARGSWQEAPLRRSSRGGHGSPRAIRCCALGRASDRSGDLVADLMPYRIQLWPTAHARQVAVLKQGPIPWAR